MFLKYSILDASLRFDGKASTRNHHFPIIQNMKTNLARDQHVIEESVASSAGLLRKRQMTEYPAVSPMQKSLMTHQIPGLSVRLCAACATNFFLQTAFLS